MTTYQVTITYTIGDTLLQTGGTFVVMRRAKDSGTAIAEVTAIFNSLSNLILETEQGVKFSYLYITRVSVTG